MTGKKANKRRLPKKSRQSLVFEELEPRLLLSADLPIDLPAVLAPDRGDDETVSIYEEITTTVATEEQHAAHELVFVDTDTPDYQLLVDDLLSNSSEDRLIEVVLLDNSRDGIAQITDMLSEYHDLDAVHIISHGSEGSIDLGGTQLEFDTLLANTKAIQGWAEAFSENGDLLIYGCNLAASADGQALVDSLARLTGADVAASDDLTGSASLDGDWELEYQQGEIETSVAISSETQNSWSKVLVNYSVNTTADTADANPGNGLAEDGTGNTSLRAAIEEANALAGADTITIGTGTYTLSLGELQISSDITITGAGVDQTFIDAATLSRVFNITSGTVTISDLTIQNGSEANGGGMYVGSAGDVTLTNVELINNSGSFGGAIYNDTGILTLNDVTIDSNTVTASGGGIYNTGIATLTGVTISNNASGINNNGGGIFTDGNSSNLIATNVTISGNNGGNAGGGIYNADTATLQNVTITNNTANKGGGLFEWGNTTTNVRNSIVSGNFSTGDGFGDIEGDFTSLGYNFIGDIGVGGGFTDGVNGDQVGAAGSPIDPLLGALADNGGPTLTHALLTGSTAINAGTSTGAPITDQLGAARDDGLIDIGAYEFDPSLPATIDLDGDDSSGTGGGGYAATWTEAGGAVAIVDTDAVVTDADDTHLESLTVSITNLFDVPNEILGFDTSGTSIAGSYDAATGVLTLSGMDTVANYQLVLRTITYNNTSSVSSDIARIVTFVANDGNSDSNIATTTISINATNAAPTFIGNTIGYWNFDEGSGDSVAESAIGISTGTLGSTAGADANDPTWTTGKFGQALHFDGINDYVEIVDAPGLDISGPEFSASLWMNPDSGPNQEDMLFMKGDRQGNINYYLSWKDSGEMTWAFKDSAGWHYQDMPVTLPTTGQWNHIAITFDRPTVSLYVNGTKYVFDNVATGGSMDRDLTANNEVLWIGAGRSGGSIVGVNQWSGPFTGSIDDLAIFDRALTDAEIEAIRTSTPSVVTATAFSLDENSANNTVVGNVVATDPDIGDTLSYAITAGNTGGAFSIDANGQIKVANSAALDFETNPVFNLTIEATDDGTPAKSDTASVSISLNDVNDAPVLVDGITVVVNEDSFGEMFYANGTVSDSDSPNFNGGTLTVTISAGGEATDRLQVSDTLLGALGMSISGNDVLDGATTIGSWAGGTGGTPLTVNFNVNATATQVEAVYRSVFYDTTSDNPTLGLRTISVEVTDGDGGTSNTATGGANLLTAYNDDPFNAGTLVTDIAVTEDILSNLDLSAIDFGDPDANAGELTVTLATSTGGQLTLASSAGITLGGSATSATVTGTLANLNSFFNTPSNIKYLHATSHLNGDNADTLAVSIVDNGNTGSGGGGSINFGLVNIDITAVNDIPVATGNTVIASEDVALVIAPGDFNFTDVELDSLVSVTITGLNLNGGTLTHSAGAVTVTNGMTITAAELADLTFTSALNDSTDSSFTYTVNDAGLGITSAVMNITVNAVNDVPVATGNTALASEDVPLVIAPGDFNFTDVEGDSLASVTITGLNLNGGTLTHSAGAVNVTNGMTITAAELDDLTFTSAFNDSTDSSFTYTVNDAGAGVTSAIMNITVNAVNDTPVSVDDSYTVDEDNTLTVDWWDTDWSRRQQLSFDNLAQTETLTDVPVLVVLNSGNIDYTQTNDDGSDLRFFAADGTPLAYEIEQWNEGGDSSVWVRVPQITSSSNSDSITMYYGNATAASGEAAGGVWDSNFVGVWHLNQEQAGTGGTDVYTDSTSYSNDGIDRVAATGQEGKVTDGQEFGANDWIEINHDPSLNLTDSMTISFWIKPTSDSGNFNRVVEKGLWGYNNSYYFGGGNGTNDLTFYLNGQEVIDTADNVLTVGQWQHAALSYTSNGDGTGTARLYLNGVEIAAGNYTAGAVVGNTERLAIGHSDPLYDFDGFVDEVQISNTDRSADWIAAQYQATRNQTGNEFVSFGGEQSAPAISGVVANDSDLDGDPLTVTLVSGPTQAASFVLNKDGTFTYTPTANYHGIDTFTYEVSDGNGGTAQATATITVNPVNDAPVAAADSFTVNEGSTTNLNLVANDTDADDGLDLSSITIVSGPTNGSLVVNANGTVDYTHDGSETVSDSFTYTIDDLATATSNTVTVSLTITPVNDAPIAVADSFTVNEGSTTNLNLATNDTDADDGLDLASITIVSGPTNGSIVVNANGTVDYTHDGSETIVDSFTYTIDDLATATSNTVTVSLTITPVNDAPIAVADSFTVNEGSTTNLNLAANDTDADDGLDLASISIVSGPTNGSLVVNANGTVDYTHDGSETVVDSFTYTIDDLATATSNTVTVSLTVTPVNDAPVAVADSFTVNEGSITNLNLATNDTDADDGLDLSSITIVSGPTNGSLVVNANGTVDYTHDGSETVVDSFTYTIDDLATATSNTVTVSLTVTPVNDAPVAVADSFTVNEGSTTNLNLATNDADADDGLDLASISIVSGPTNGSIVVNANGTVDYTHDGSETIVDSFTYTIDDLATATSNTVTVSLTVTPVNNAPVAVADSFTVNEGSTTNLNLATNDTDADDGLDLASITIVSGPANGSIVVNANGTVDYTHDGSETVADSFTYTIDDLAGAVSNTVTVNLTVTPVNDAPIAVTDSYTVNEGSTTNLNLATNDTDADDGLDLASITIVSGPTNGSLVVNANGTVDYTHDGSETIVDSFTYTIDDLATATSNTVTVSLTVTPVNDAPLAVADSFTVNEGSATNLNLATNDTDADDGLDLSSITIVSGATNGSLVVNANGTVDYTHDGSETVADSFTYTIDDVAGATSNTVTVNLTITPVNDAPVAVADSFTVNEGSTTNLDLATNDSDADDGLDLASITIVSGPANGSIVVNANGTVDYTHDGSETIVDSFTYTIDDLATATSNTVTVSLTITPVNDAPVAVADSFTVNEGSTTNLNLATNDSDADDGLDLASISIVSGPTNGSLVVNANGTVDYTHDGSETISDSFTYTIDDLATATSNTVTVSLTITPVNDAPVAVADSFTVNEGSTTNLNLATNDTDSDDGLDLNSITIVSGPTNGSLVVNADGTVDYTHDGSETVVDSFTYTIDDLATATSNTVTVSLTVTPVNDAPVAVADSFTVSEGSTTNLNLATNDSDADDGLDLSSITIVSGPTNGSLVVNANGTVDYTHDGSETLSDSFTYTIDDLATATSNTVTANLTVTPVNDAPVAVADSFTVNEGSTMNLDLATNDSDADDGLDLASITIVSGPTNGSLVVNANGTVDYTHDESETVADSFTYTIDDLATATSNTVTVSLTITPVNDAPIAVADSFTVNEGSTTNLNLAINDTDADDGLDLASISIVSGPTNGSLVVNANGTVDYTHDGSETVVDSFTYTIDDLAGATSNTETVSLTITPVNDAPVAVADSFTVNEGSTTNLNLATNDSDADDGLDLASITIVSGPTNGSLVVNANGTVDYTHDGSETVADSFTYTIDDLATATSNTVTVSLTVTPVNDAPVAVADSFTVNEGSTTNLNLATNDSDADDGIDLASITIVSGPTNGSIVVNANGTVDYTHDGSETVADSFTYTIDDLATATSNTVTVNLTVTPVNDAPIAVTDSYTVNEGSTTNLNLATNDTDADDGLDLASITIVSGPANGSIVVNANGTVDYTHDGSETVVDSFTYTIDDLATATSNTVTVSLTITPVNDAPVAVADSFTVNEGSTTNLNLATNDSDADDGLDLASITIVSGPTNGSIVVNANGTVDYTHDGSETVADSFTYTIDDLATATSNTVTVSLTITPVNDAPVAVADSFTVNEGSTANLNLATNDTDADDGLDLASITIVSGPTNGSIVVNANGTVDYTHNGFETIVDSFTYTIDDLATATSNTVTVSLTITPVNDAPVATADSFTVNEGSTTNLNLAANDTDADDGLDLASISIVSGPTNGSLVVNANGTVDYTHDGSETVVDSFTYTIDDLATATSNTVTVSLTVTPVNDAPVAVADSFTVNEGSTTNLNLASNDTDADDGLDLTSITIVSGPTNGSIVVNANGTVDYTHDGSETVVDSFTYTIDDLVGATSNTVTVSLTVTPVNDAPLAVADSFTVNEGSTTNLNLAANDTDADDGLDLSSITIISGPANGSIVVNANGTVDYTHDGSETIVDSFTYTIDDLATATSNTVTVSLTVTPVNDAPVAVADSFTVNEGSTTNLNLATNDTDADDGLDLASISIVSGPTNGAIVVNANGTVDYTHDGSETLSDSFAYTIDDLATATSNTVTVSLTITPLNDAPVLVGANDLTTISEDPISNPGTLVSDLISTHITDDDTGPLTGIAVTGVDNTNGSWEFSTNSGSTWTSFGSPSISTARLLAADASTLVRFIPNADFNGTVAGGLNFHAWDQTSGLIGDIVNISGMDTVTDGFDTVSYANNDGTQNWTTDWIESDNSGGGASGGFIYVNGGSLQLNVAAGDSGDNIYREIDLSGATSATLNFDYQNLLSGEDEIRIQVSGNGGSSYTTVMTFTGTQNTGNNIASIDVSSYIASDTRIRFFVFKNDAGADLLIDNVEVVYDNATTAPGGETAFSSGSQSSGIDVTPVNDAPTAANNTVITNEDTTYTFTAADFNFSDIDGDTLASVKVINLEAVGSLQLSGVDVTLNQVISKANIDAGNLKFVPIADANGAGYDSFSFSVNDGTVDSAMSYTMIIDVTAVNDAPIATADSFTVNEGSTTNLNLATNDTDADDGVDLASITIVSGPTNGSIVVNANGTVDYTHDGSETLSDSFTYTIDDLATATSNTVTVSLTITPVNDAPVAVADSFTVNEGSTTNLNLATNDSDADDGLDLSSITLVSGPTNGSIVVNANGTVDYTHDGSETVADSFTYTIDDLATATSNTMSVSLTITPVNDAPLAVADSFTVNEGSTTNLNLTTNDTDADDGLDLSSITLVSGPTNGSIVVNANGTVDYTHDGSETVADSFTYTIDDLATATSNTVTVSLTVTPVNDAPVAVADSFTVNEGSTTNLNLATNDTDADDGLDLSSITIVSGPTNGSIVVNANGTVDYTHDGSETIVDSFTYTIDDLATATSNTVIVSLTVTPVNDAPVAVADSFTVNEGSTTNLNLATNDTDADDGLDLASITIVSGPTNASIVVNADGTVDYIHDGSETVADSFTYTISDASGATSAVGTVNLTIDPVNDAPIHSVPAAQSTAGTTPLVFSSLNGNSIMVADPDASGAPVEVTLSVSNGTLSLAGAAGLSFSAGDGSSDATMTFTGTSADINAALNGLSFQADADYEGMAAVQIITDDLGNAGTGGALNALDRVNITVTASAPIGIAQDTLLTLDELILEDMLDLSAPAPELKPVNKANVAPAAEEAAQAVTPASVAESATTTTPDSAVDALLGSGRGVATQADVSLPGVVELFGQNLQPHDDDRPSSVRLIGHVIRQGLVDPFTYAKMLNPLQPDMAIWESIEAMMEQMDGRDTSWYSDDQVLTTTTATGLTVSFTVGYVSWLLRAGYLSASLMSVLPLWREFDPLPVLAATTRKKKRKSADDGKDSQQTNDIESESIFSSNETV